MARCRSRAFKALNVAHATVDDEFRSGDESAIARCEKDRGLATILPSNFLVISLTLEP